MDSSENTGRFVVDLQTIVLPLEGRDHFPLWKLKMTAIFMSLGVWEALTEEGTPMDTASSQLVYAAIIMSLRTDDLRMMLSIPPGDGRAAWKALLEEFERVSMANKLSLHRRLLAVQNHYAGNPVGASLAINALAERMKALGTEVSDDTKLCVLLNAAAQGAGPAITAIIAGMEYSETIVTYEDACRRFREASILTREKGMKEIVSALQMTRSSNASSHAASAQNARSSYSSPIEARKCFHCGGPHLLSNCPHKSAKKAQQTGAAVSTTAAKKCFHCGGPHFVDQCPQKSTTKKKGDIKQKHDESVKCFICGGPHYAKSCPRKPTNNEDDTSKSSNKGDNKLKCFICEGSHLVKDCPHRFHHEEDGEPRAAQPIDEDEVQYNPNDWQSFDWELFDEN